MEIFNFSCRSRRYLSRWWSECGRKRAPFSSYGPSYDGRIKPDAVAVGWDTYVANQRGKTLRANGTSFASI